MTQSTCKFKKLDSLYEDTNWKFIPERYRRFYEEIWAPKRLGSSYIRKDLRTGNYRFLGECQPLWDGGNVGGSILLCQSSPREDSLLE